MERKSSLLLQQPFQLDGLVGRDEVYAAVNEPLHHLGVVHRP